MKASLINKFKTGIVCSMSLIILFSLAYSCKNSTKSTTSSEQSISADNQDSVFSNLIKLTNNTIPGNLQYDSLAFLILPLHASCPSCRQKTIDSIVQYKDRLPGRHYIIISAKGGRKTINSFFREQHKELPFIENRLFLDSFNHAFKYDLYDEQPTMYYTANGKAYKKAIAIPATVRQDLHAFFSGMGYYSQLTKK